HPGQVGGPEPGVPGPDPRPRLAEAGAAGGDADVAEDVEHVPSTDRDPVDRRDHRLWGLADPPVQVLDPEDAVLGRAVVAGLGALLLVAAGAERLLAGAGQDHRPDVLVRPGLEEGVHQLVDGPAAEGVVAGGAVDGGDRRWAFDGVEDVRVVSYVHVAS